MIHADLISPVEPVPFPGHAHYLKPWLTGNLSGSLILQNASSADDVQPIACLPHQLLSVLTFMQCAGIAICAEAISNQGPQPLIQPLKTSFAPPMH